MASEEQILRVFNELNKCNPLEFVQSINETVVGIGAVLRCLNEADEAVTAGKLSEVLNVSTARIAALLKKMVAKGLITRERDAEDRRVVVIRLTELGESKAQEMHNNMLRNLGHVIDVVGEERMLEYMEISSEIRAAVKKPNIQF